MNRPKFRVSIDDVSRLIEFPIRDAVFIERAVLDFELCLSICTSEQEAFDAFSSTLKEHLGARGVCIRALSQISGISEVHFLSLSCPYAKETPRHTRYEREPVVVSLVECRAVFLYISQQCKSIQ